MLISLKQTAERVGLSASTLNKYRITGKGPRFYYCGRYVRYDPADVDEWMRSRCYHSTSERQIAEGRGQ